MHHHDPHYRRMFGHPAIMRALLEGFMPAPLLAMLNLDSLQIVPTEHLADPQRQRHSDLIWRVRRTDLPGGRADTGSSRMRDSRRRANDSDQMNRVAGHDGEDVFLVILLEHQSSGDRIMALRMASYTGLTYQTLLDHKLLRPRQPLPLILPIVLYSGVRRWRHATSMQALQGPVPDFLRPYQLNHDYLLLDMGRLVHKGGLPEDNLASLIFQLEHNERVEQAGALMQAIVQQVASSADGQALTRILGAWARHILLPRALPERIKLPDTEELSELTAMTIAYSRDWTRRPREEGRQEGQAELLAHLLERKFGTLPPAYQQRLSGAGVDDLMRWSLNVLDAQTLEQVFT